MRLFKGKTKQFFIRSWWTYYIYWIPTIQTEYHPIEDSILCNFDVGDSESYRGNNFGINLYWLIWVINIDYWWKVKEKVWKQ